MLTQSHDKDAFHRARANVQVLLDHRNTFTVGWCAAFVQWGRIYIVQRAAVSS